MSLPSRIFCIPEILEMILHQLPARELLLSTQVNKQFYNVIRSSPELQHKLYFKVEVVAKGGRIFPLEYNPLMKFCWPKDNSGVLKTNLESFHRYDLPTASWKDMFVTTPAVTYLYVISGGVPCTRLESESGITMGQLVKSQQERYKEEINPNRSEDLFIYYGTYSWIEKDFKGKVYGLDMWYNSCNKTG